MIRAAGMTDFIVRVVFLFFVLGFVLIFVPFLFLYFQDKHLRTRGETASVDLMTTKAQLGDVLGISNCQLQTQVLSVLTQSIWTHVAMVFVDPHSGLKYVVEIGNKGFRQSPLDQWIEFHQQKSKIIWRPRKLSTTPSAAVCDQLNEFVGKKLNRNYVQWLTGHLFGRKVGELGNHHGKKLFCSEFVATLLQKMNILPTTKHPALYTPGELIDGQLDFYSASKLVLPGT